MAEAVFEVFRGNREVGQTRHVPRSDCPGMVGWMHFTTSRLTKRLI